MVHVCFTTCEPETEEVHDHFYTEMTKSLSQNLTVLPKKLP